MPSDDFLVESVRGGDQAALRALMDRYDRLVRFAIFRLSKSECHRDPHWLETIAGDTWIGFVRSLQRSPDLRPKSVKAYLTTIARFKVVSARRGVSLPSETSVTTDETTEISVDQDDPLDLLADLESLETLRACVRKLDELDRSLYVHIEAIVERRWVEAASALGMSESTLRSRWKRVLERLRECMNRKTGRDFAP
jgi:RNA polymerase sigma factor (sigma-70 family)